METDETSPSIPLCVKCKKKEVYVDKVLNVQFKFCSPQCRDERLLKNDVQRLKSDIAQLERMPLVGESVFLKYALTKSQAEKLEGRANSICENVERSGRFFSNSHMEASKFFVLEWIWQGQI